MYIKVNIHNQVSRQKATKLIICAQDAGSQLMFPLEVAMHLDAEEAPSGVGGSLPDLPRVPSTCSTAAYLEAYAAAGAAGGCGGAKLVLGSAPAAPIAIGRGILHNSVTKINRKNSQVCFRDECEVDSPLLPQRQHHANQPPGEQSVCVTSLNV
jgi:hypothetical protein